MSKQVQEAYIVAATRTPIGKAPRGFFRNTRPDDLLVAAVKSALAQVPSLDPKAIEDAVIGCSFPEAESGINMARVAMVLASYYPREDGAERQARTLAGALVQRGIGVEVATVRQLCQIRKPNDLVSSGRRANQLALHVDRRNLGRWGDDIIHLDPRLPSGFAQGQLDIRFGCQGRQIHFVLRSDRDLSGCELQK